jgi:hypothetical protein
MVKKSLIGLIAALMFVSVVVNPAYARNLVVRVPAAAEWVDSGIDIAIGETVFLKAKGMAITGPLKDYPLARSGAAGQVTTCVDDAVPGGVCVLSGVPFGALVGKIGVGGSPFLIGDAASFVSVSSGRLYLVVNDFIGEYADNQAGFTVIFKD